MGSTHSCEACGSGRNHKLNKQQCMEKQEKHRKALEEKGKKLTEPTSDWYMYCEECEGYGVPKSEWKFFGTKKQGSCQTCSGTGVVEKCDCGKPLIKTSENPKEDACHTCWMLPSPQTNDDQRLIDMGREKDQDAVCPALLLKGWEAVFDKSPCSACKNTRYIAKTGYSDFPLYPSEFKLPEKEVFDTRIAYKSPKGKRICRTCYNEDFKMSRSVFGKRYAKLDLSYDTDRRRLGSSSHLSPLTLLFMLPLLFLVYWFVVRRFTQTSRKAGTRQHPGETGNFTHSAVEPALDMV